MIIRLLTLGISAALALYDDNFTSNACEAE